MLIENSRFDNNEDGFDTNSQNGDEPAASKRGVPRRRRAAGCRRAVVLGALPQHVRSQQQPEAPSAGSAAAGPVGHRHVAVGRPERHRDGQPVRGQRRVGPDHDSVSRTAASRARAASSMGSGRAAACSTKAATHVIDNTFSHNGFFGNPSNGDLGPDELRAGPDQLLQRQRGARRRRRHHHPGESRADVPDVQRADGRRQRNGGRVVPDEVLCDAQVSLAAGAKPPCQPTDHYPRRTKVVMHPLPKHLATMPNPCAGVPAESVVPGKEAAG